MNLAWGAVVTDEKHYVSGALFNVEVAEIEAPKEGAEEDQFVGDVLAVYHFCQDMGFWIF
jgi:hypothetical protein